MPDAAGLARGGARSSCEDDHEFLLKGDVFTEDVIETWIEYKTEEGGRRRCGCARIRTSSPCTSTFRSLYGSSPVPRLAARHGPDLRLRRIAV